ncbi:xanthine dehydrogenase small subunit [Piscinibacter sakaiensis]|uniref:xanthine dehydrogenase small subunit n=1 Tax=Piscinibacter sakaiensis TaxID=1547922 RepID=UPI003AAAA3D3
MTTQTIRFYHRGELVAIDDVAPTRTVLDWLREDARCTGTKEGCNEGDCGACTVLIGELPDPAALASASTVRGLNLYSVNACIQFLPTLHGKALFTVEDLQTIAAASSAAMAQADPNVVRLHPVQQAMVDCHASQCGFCTPGFVMSLFGSYEQHRQCGSRPTRQQLADELSGNLCRCTGYRPILDAGQRMFDLPPVSFDTKPVIDALRTLADAGGLHYQPAAARAPTGAVFLSPRTLDELAALREEKPQATLLAGSTDIGLWVNKLFRPIDELIYLGDVAELKRIADVDGALRIGAGASLEAAWQALAARFPTLTDVWLRFASPPIRHAGTMGGNVANGSPIGDSAPVLMALGARLLLRRGRTQRSMPLDAFYLDYMKNALAPGEFVEAIEVPAETLAAGDAQLRAYKISKRFDCDISAVCAGFWLRLDGDRVAEIRLAFGGMAATVKRAAATEAALLGKPWTQASVEAAQAELANDFQPLTDMRASADYRSEVVRNLLQRFWLETRAEAPLGETQTSVWSVMPHQPLPV